MGHGPAVRRRKLGEELRKLRDDTGLTSGEAAGLVGWHQSKVSRIETGRSGVKPADVARLLEAYGVRDPELRALLQALADSAGGAGVDWAHAYRGLLPTQYRDFISLESQARSARTLETSVVPGLLQTPAYARAVTRAALGGCPRTRWTRSWRCGSPARRCCAAIRRWCSARCSTRRYCVGEWAARRPCGTSYGICCSSPHCRTCGCRSSLSITAAMSA